MDENTKIGSDMKPVPSASATSVGNGVAYDHDEVNPPVSVWKKFLYNLWDADGHLKSPQVTNSKPLGSLKPCLTS